MTEGDRFKAGFLLLDFCFVCLILVCALGFFLFVSLFVFIYRI